ncbi:MULTISPECIES: hypothetical protein [unclassified Stenotrophomonas maltophilia group]|uniref:hypothetical protein n=1 Tax=unclassified Stenotrophomonas maltophilia group TaxID=2961925 RepID=UPI000D540CF2|nr:MULTISPECIES: hypothetical protein [unclassified Stenotrophomonas maltophilia group]AWH29446.1 hypothetical protein C1931_11250 [Stenotrophomonas sp. YAU14A_MKIMI4_1]AWH33437.1 hypothetical protein C1930_11475 [Stenotrophomonas sp. SAU14A_NAIMI4_8]
MSGVVAGAVLALLLAVPVQAQTNVYKCVDGPHPVYQQTPCQGRAEWKWQVPADTSSASPTVPAAAARPRKRHAGAARAVLIPIERDPAGCSRARQRRAEALRPDYLQQRQLDDAVRAACH